MKVQILVPATAAGASLLTALSGLMIGSRATFLAVVLIVAVAAWLTHKAAQGAQEPPRVVEATAALPPAAPQAVPTIEQIRTQLRKTEA